MATTVGAFDVVALQELRAYLRIDGEAEDFLLHDLLRSATATVEQWLGLPLIHRDIEERAPIRDRLVQLAMGSVQAVLAVAVVGGDGIAESLGPGAWEMVRLPGDVTCVQLLAPANGMAEVSYRAGIASDWNGVPDPVRLAILRCAAHFHSTRDDPSAPPLPPVIRQLLEPFRVRHIS